MGRPDDGRMHELAKRASTKGITDLNDHLADRKSVVVAVERHDYDWRDGRIKLEDRFLWIRATEVSLLGKLALNCETIPLTNVHSRARSSK